MIRLLFALLFFYSIAFPVNAETIYIGVASNFIKPVKKIITQFEQQTGHQVKMSFGSSGKLYAQITHGAPFALFLSADQEKAQKLVDAEYAKQSQVATYAIGQLVLWSAKEEFKGREQLRLVNKQFNKIAIANPKLAPYGLAAQHVLAPYQLSQSQLVVGENINQAFQFVATGNADLGLIANAQLPAKEEGWLIPATLYPAIKQDMVLLNTAENSQAAKQLFAFIKGEESQEIIRSYGYKLPLES